MAKSNYVTRRVVEARKYDIYSNQLGQLTKVGEEVISGKPNTIELAKKYNVEKVVTVETEQIKKVYGMLVDDFMKYAVDITNQEQ